MAGTSSKSLGILCEKIFGGLTSWAYKQRSDTKSERKIFTFDFQAASLWSQLQTELRRTWLLLKGQYEHALLWLFITVYIFTLLLFFVLYSVIVLVHYLVFVCSLFSFSFYHSIPFLSPPHAGSFLPLLISVISIIVALNFHLNHPYFHLRLMPAVMRG